MVDPEAVRSLLDRLGEEIAHLHRLGDLSVEQLRDPDLLAAVPDLQRMARFRNLLVHGYQKVARVVEILRSRVEDVDRLRRGIAARISR